VKFKARGGQGDIRYSLPSSTPGVSIDEKTGTLSVDSTLAWKSFQERISRLGAHLQDELEAHIKSCRQDYRQLFGETTQQLPFRVRLCVAAEDEHGQSAVITSFLTLLGSNERNTHCSAAGDRHSTSPGPRKRCIQ